MVNKGFKKPYLPFLGLGVGGKVRLHMGFFSGGRLPGHHPQPGVLFLAFLQPPVLPDQLCCLSQCDGWCRKKPLILVVSLALFWEVSGYQDPDRQLLGLWLVSTSS